MCQYNNELKWVGNEPKTVYKILKKGVNNYEALFATVKKSATSHPRDDVPFVYKIGETYTEEYETLTSTRNSITRGFFHSFPHAKTAFDYKNFLKQTTTSYYGNLVVCECEIPPGVPYYRGTYDIDITWFDVRSIASKAITIKRVIPDDELEKMI